MSIEQSDTPDLIFAKDTQEKFDTWRKNKSFIRERVPDNLKKQAIELANRAGYPLASKYSKISAGKLKKWASPDEIPPTVDFVEFRMPVTHAINAHLELTCGETPVRLHLKGVSIEQVSSLVRRMT